MIKKNKTKQKHAAICLGFSRSLQRVWLSSKAREGGTAVGSAARLAPGTRTALLSPQCSLRHQTAPAGRSPGATIPRLALPRLLALGKLRPIP